MKPFRIRVNRLIDFGAIVTLIGVDAEASKPVTVHVDYRPFDVVWAAWRDIGSKQPIEYAADGLTLTLGVAGEDHIEGALIGEAEIINPASPNRFREALQIVDPGASNPSGIANAIVAACAEVRREGGSTANVSGGDEGSGDIADAEDRGQSEGRSAKGFEPTAERRVNLGDRRIEGIGLGEVDQQQALVGRTRDRAGL